MKKIYLFSEAKLIFNEVADETAPDQIIKAHLSAQASMEAREGAATDKLAEVEDRALKALAEKTGTTLKRDLKGNGSQNNFFADKDGTVLFNVYKSPEGKYMLVQQLNGQSYPLRSTETQSLTDLLANDNFRFARDMQKEQADLQKLVQSTGLDLKGEVDDKGNIHFNFDTDGKTNFHISYLVQEGQYYLVKHTGKQEAAVNAAKTIEALVSNNFLNARSLASNG